MPSPLSPLATLARATTVDSSPHLRWSTHLRWCVTCADETPHERPDGDLAPSLACVTCGSAFFLPVEPFLAVAA